MKLKTLVPLVLLVVSQQAFSMPVFDVPAEASLASLVALVTTMGAELNSVGQQITAAVTQSAKNQQESQKFAQEAQNLESARRSFTVPTSICAESASGEATQINNWSASNQAGLTNGSLVKNNAIERVITNTTDDTTTNAENTAAIHANYCTAQDYKLYGSAVCNGVSDLPDGDISASSLINGASKDHQPVLTFNSQQIDAARMYIQNATVSQSSPKLTKGEVNTPSGKIYQGLYDKVMATQSATQLPAIQMLAASLPNPNTKQVLQEDMSTPSAKAYFNETASPVAKQTGEMSSREFTAFEVGRRYANTDYETDLQAMSGDNLLREQIRVESLQNYLLLKLNNKESENNVLQGQILAQLNQKNYTNLQKLYNQIQGGAK